MKTPSAVMRFCVCPREMSRSASGRQPRSDSSDRTPSRTALHKHDITRPPLRAPKTRADASTLTCNAKQTHAVAPPQIEIPRAAPDDGRPRSHHGLHEDGFLVLEQGLHVCLFVPDEVELAGADQRLDRVALAGHDEQITLPQRAPGPWPRDAALAPHDGEDLHVLQVELGERHAGGGTALTHGHLGEIRADMHQLCAAHTRFAPGYEPPAPQDEEEHAPNRHQSTDRGEVEEPEGRSDRLLAEARHDQVGWGADQRRHAAEQGAERERHQEERRRPSAVPRETDRHRHQQGQGPHVVDECGEHRHRDREAGQQGERTCAQSLQWTRCPLDHAGGREGMTHHEYRGDGHDGGVPEPTECLIRRHQSHEGCRHESHQRDQVVAVASPKEEQQGRGQDSGKQPAVKQHRRGG